MNFKYDQQNTSLVSYSFRSQKMIITWMKKIQQKNKYEEKIPRQGVRKHLGNKKNARKKQQTWEYLCSKSVKKCPSGPSKLFFWHWLSRFFLKKILTAKNKKTFYVSQSMHLILTWSKIHQVYANWSIELRILFTRWRMTYNSDEHFARSFIAAMPPLLFSRYHRYLCLRIAF